MRKFLLVLIIMIIANTLLIACKNDNSKEVVIYTSVDRNYAEPVLKKFEEVSKINVKAVYDTEAVKTTGLVNRLITEADNPVADVFWNGEFSQTVRLKDEGVLDKYKSPKISSNDNMYSDEEGHWSAFGGRARVFLVNKNKLNPEQYPQSIFDILNPSFHADKIGIANPIFGTTATHSAALYNILGEKEAEKFFDDIISRGVSVVDGNSVVRDMVVDGSLYFGLTDTDDSLSAIKKGAPVEIVFPDQDEGAMGTLVVPNTISLIKNCPNPDEAKTLIDFILGEEGKDMLIESGWINVSSLPDDKGQYTFQGNKIKTMDISLNEIYEKLSTSKKSLTKKFIK